MDEKKKNTKRIGAVVVMTVLVLMACISIGIIHRNKTDRTRDGYQFNLFMDQSNKDYLTMADGRIYYRSQTDHYYLYSSAADGSDKRRLATKIPGAIFVVGDDVYFINVSDGKGLYRIQKDGGGLEQVIDQSIRDIVLLDDVFYYIAAYSERYDKDGSVRDPVRGYAGDVPYYDPYVYSYKIGEDGPRLLSDRFCGYYLLSDGKEAYAELWETEGYSTVCISDGGSKASPQGLVYGDSLYHVDHDEDRAVYSLWQEPIGIGRGKEIVCTEEEIQDIRFLGGHVYISVDDRIQRTDLSTLETETILSGLEDMLSYVLLPDGQIFVKCSVPGGYGELWYRYDEGAGQLVLFEETEGLPHMIASFLAPPGEDRPYTYVLPDGSVFIPYITPEEVRETYIDREMVYQNGEISIGLPMFSDAVPAYRQINRNLQVYMDSSIQKGREVIASQYPDKRNYKLRVFYVYVDDRYVCLTYMENFEERRHDINTLLFSAETGEQLCLDDLFSVPREIYEGYIFFAIGKAQELYDHSDPPSYAVHPLDEGDMVKYYDINKFTLTEQGLVVFYHKGTIENVNWGTPFFEIDHQYFSDIYRK